MNNPDYKFLCRKCMEHLLFVSRTDIKKIERLPQIHCPACGEEGAENWIFIGTGNYNKEFPNH